MSSLWLVASASDIPASNEGFHVSEESARARAAANPASDRAWYDDVKQYLEIPFEECRAINGLPATYEVLEVPDVAGDVYAMPSGVDVGTATKGVCSALPGASPNAAFRSMLSSKAPRTSGSGGCDDRV